jgi:hypothetical protein
MMTRRRRRRRNIQLRWLVSPTDRRPARGSIPDMDRESSVRHHWVQISSEAHQALAALADLPWGKWRTKPIWQKARWGLQRVWTQKWWRVNWNSVDRCHCMRGQTDRARGRHAWPVGSLTGRERPLPVLRHRKYGRKANSWSPCHCYASTRPSCKICTANSAFVWSKAQYDLSVYIFECWQQWHTDVVQHQICLLSYRANGLNGGWNFHLHLLATLIQWRDSKPNSSGKFHCL